MRRHSGLWVLWAIDYRLRCPREWVAPSGVAGLSKSGGMGCRTYRGGVTSHPAYAKAQGQIREHLLLAVLAGGAPCPVYGSPMLRYRPVDLHHSGAAGR